MSDISGSTIIAIVDALIGETAPYGDTYVDHERMCNQQKLKELTNHLLDRLYLNAKYRNRVEYSMKQIGEDAAEFLGYMVEEYELDKFVREEE